jgi:hypothetical protein
MLLQFYITFIKIIRLRELLESEKHRVSTEAMQNRDMDATETWMQLFCPCAR